MERDIKLYTRLFLDSQGEERETIFRERIYPFTEEIISGVFLSLKLFTLPDQDLQDIRQEIYLKILSRLSNRGIRSFKNYYFISIKNITIDYLRSHNRDKKFNEYIQELIYNRLKYGSNSRHTKTEQTEDDNLQ